MQRDAALAPAVPPIHGITLSGMVSKSSLA